MSNSYTAPANGTAENGTYTIQIYLNVTTSSPPIESTTLGEYLFLYWIIVVGVIGTIANGSIFSIISTQSRFTNMTTSTKFILNQLFCDLVTSASLILVYGWRIAISTLHANWSNVSCILVGGEVPVWLPYGSSIFNLSFITLERYVKIVHNSFHQEYYRDWMTYLIIASTWIISSGLASIGFYAVYFRPGAESLRGLFEMADQRWRIDIQRVLIRGFLLVSVADLHLLLLANHRRHA